MACRGDGRTLKLHYSEELTASTAVLQQSKMNKLCWKNECVYIYIYIYTHTHTHTHTHMYVCLSEWGSEPLLVVVSRTTDGKFVPDPSIP